MFSVVAAAHVSTCIFLEEIIRTIKVDGLQVHLFLDLLQEMENRLIVNLSKQVQEYPKVVKHAIFSAKKPEVVGEHVFRRNLKWKRKIKLVSYMKALSPPPPPHATLLQLFTLFRQTIHFKF